MTKNVINDDLNKGYSSISKNYFFGRKIVIFHTTYPNNLRASLRSAQFL
jgi:hypothetical protein